MKLFTFDANAILFHTVCERDLRKQNFYILAN